LGTNPFTDFFSSSKNLAVTKPLTPNYLTPSTMNKTTRSSVYSSTSGETRGLSQGPKTLLNVAH